MSQSDDHLSRWRLALAADWPRNIKLLLQKKLTKKVTATATVFAIGARKSSHDTPAAVTDTLITSPSDAPLKKSAYPSADGLAPKIHRHARA